MNLIFRKLLNKFRGKRHLYEKKIDSLEKKVEELNQRLQPVPPVLIERLYVDRIIVEKMDNSSNIANLGIKDLGGALNIGVTYGNPVSPKQDAGLRQGRAGQGGSGPGSMMRRVRPYNRVER